MKRGRTGEAEPDPPGFAARRPAGGVDRMIDLLQNGLRLGKQHLAGLGQFNPARLALKQLRAKLGFERADLLTERRLLDAQALRRAGDMPLLGNRDEVARMAQFHIVFHIDNGRCSYIGQRVAIDATSVCAPDEARRSDRRPAWQARQQLLDRQFLRWVAERPRRYAEMREAWSSTCPLNCAWEDASPMTSCATPPTACSS